MKYLCALVWLCVFVLFAEACPPVQAKFVPNAAPTCNTAANDPSLFVPNSAPTCNNVQPQFVPNATYNQQQFVPNAAFYQQQYSQRFNQNAAFYQQRLFFQPKVFHRKVFTTHVGGVVSPVPSVFVKTGLFGRVQVHVHH